MVASGRASVFLLRTKTQRTIKVLNCLIWSGSTHQNLSHFLFVVAECFSSREIFLNMYRLGIMQLGSYVFMKPGERLVKSFLHDSL